MESTKPATTETSSNWLMKLAVGLVVAVILGWLFRGFLWKVLEAFMLNVLPIVFTPVILELSVGFTGLLVVAIFCHIRRKEQEDEWVYIAQVEPENEMESIPEPLRRRVGETVMKSEPEEVESDGLALGAIEGMIDLEMFDEADKQLRNGSELDQRRPEFLKMRLQVLLRLENWSEASEFSSDRPPAVTDKLAVICVEAARIFIKQKPASKDAATECLELGKRLSVSAVMEAIDGDRKLQKLA